MWMLHGDKIRLSEGCELQNQIWAFLYPSLTKMALFLKDFYIPNQITFLQWAKKARLIPYKQSTICMTS